ncbi:MAG: FadR family transcriptional regulator [Desulfobulbus sp.]|uniref:FadR/GntR family transcriptional regulator n=1 Tax=Desulfobulbus sp. TaxID=895 RepID=UPI00284A1F5A|nr:FadR/GntR family transcriptional regulator [Desulfobulbus sp.]MDR2549292.1 FadR family transcriptional regulator [Desulfobulbus sp.]
MTSSLAKEDRKYTYTVLIERIGAMIRNGELQPGSKLPPERKMAEMFGVSRSSLRQAFQALAERGIIESRQGDGTYLLAAIETPLSTDAIADAISEQSGLLYEVVEFRRLVEPPIAALAARRISAEGIDRLKILVCDQQRALTVGRDADGFDAEFHQVLAESAGNRVIARVMSAIQSIVNESRSVWLQTSERRLASMEGHLRIIDALEARDAAAASLAMERHIAEIERHIFGEHQETSQQVAREEPDGTIRPPKSNISE